MGLRQALSAAAVWRRSPARDGRRRARRVSEHNRIPLLIAAPSLIAFFLLLTPLLAMIIRAPWSDLGELLLAEDVLSALRISLQTATIATALSVLLGVPLAWVLARASITGISLLRALVTLPLILPPVVGGIALLLALGRNGIVGRYLDDYFGLTLPFTTAAVVIAQVFVAMPFLIVSVEGALRSSESEIEEAAITLGASRLTVLGRVTLPAIFPALAAGTVLCWARALGEFGATITFAGNLPGSTQTMPLAIYQAFQLSPDAAVALGLILLAVALIVLVLLRGRWLPARTTL